MVWVGGRDGHRKVGTYPLGTIDPQLFIRKDPLPGRETQREWRASVVLGAESLLLGTRISVPVCKDLARRLENIIRNCASGPFDDGHRVTRSSHLHRRHIMSSRWEIFPPMLAEDTELHREYDGIVSPKDMGESANHPSERQGEAARAKGAGETADGIVLPCLL